MLKFKQFLYENKQDDSYNFFYSNEFGQILLKIKNEISNDLINSYDTEKSKYTYIDITKDEDYISYLNYKDAFELDELDKDVWNNKKRKIIKIGKFINKFFNFKHDPQTVQKFINSYKSILRESKIFFKIYKGNNILKWYNLNNTELMGTLGSSCMRYKRCQNYLNLYDKNPDKISLLVLFEKDKKKSIGRALLWKLDNNDLFMDRIYVSYDYDKEIFLRYAKNNNININKIDDKNGMSKVHTYLKPLYYDNYPYLDTLNIYQPETGLITDTIKYCDLNKEIYILDDVFGSFRLYQK